MTDPTQWCFETKQIHAGQAPDTATGARALPIYQTTSYVFDDTDHAANLFALKEFGNIYTRIMNPTQDVVEQRIAALEGGVGGAARRRPARPPRRSALLNIAEAGDHIVASAARSTAAPSTCSSTRFPKLGIEVTLRRGPRRPRGVARRGPPEHQGVLRRDDRQPARRHPRHRGGRRRRPRARRAAHRRQHHRDALPHPPDRVGRRHRRALGDEVPRRPRHLDRRRHRRRAATSTSRQDPEKFPNYNTPEESYHGLVFARDLGVGSPLGANLAYILKARVQLLRDLGPSAISPFNAFLIAQGLETL